MKSLNFLPTFIAFTLAFPLNKLQTDSTKNAPDWNPTQNPFPPVRRNDSISFQYPSESKGMNVTVGDPYHWFEDTDSSQDEIKKFVDDQVAFTQKYLDKITNLDTIRSSIKSASDYTLIELPIYGGPKDSPLYTYFVANSTAVHGIYYLVSEEELQLSIENQNFSSLPGTKFINTKLVGLNKTVMSISLSPDGTKAAYKVLDVDVFGNTSLYFRNVSDPLIEGENVEGGENHFQDVIFGDGFDAAFWAKDSNSFFYQFTQYVASPTDNSSFGQDIIRYHILGKDSANDISLVLPIPDPDVYISFDISDDLDYIIVYSNHLSLSLYSVYIASIDQQQINSPLKWVAIQIDSPESLLYSTNIDKDFYFSSISTDLKKSFVHIELDLSSAKKTANLTEVTQGTIKQDLIFQARNDSAFKGYSTFDTDKILIYYVKDDLPQTVVHNLKTGEVLSQFNPIQPFEYIDGHTNPTGKNVFLYTSSFNTPVQLQEWKWDSDKKAFETTTFYQAKPGGIDPNEFTVQQMFAKSKDGTQIPINTIYHNSTKFDGTQPSILTFGGAFGISANWFYYPPFLAFLKTFGGIVLFAAVRGGSDEGDQWHLDGSLLNKTNTFDDIFAVAEFAIDQKYTQTGKIIIDVISDGAMSGAVVLNQDKKGLFGAFLGKDGLYDILRLDQTIFNKTMIEEYGDPHDPTYFDFLFSYSPLDNIERQKPYPTIYLTLGHAYEKWHTFKYLSTLQNLLPQNPNPLLLGDSDIDLDEHEARSYAIAAHALNLQIVG